MKGIKANLKKRKIFFILLALFLLYALWLSFDILRFKTYRSSAAEKSPLEIEGTYHMHSKFSDGTKDADHIARIASSAGLDFIIFTDHGSPNYESYSSQGWKDGVLVLAGSELSVSRGHLVALGFELPSSHFSQNAEEAVYEVTAKRGFTVIAHPYSKVQWSWGEFVGYSGIEIIDADTMIRKNVFSSILYLPALLVKPRHALLKLLYTPYRALRKWDELNSIHPVYAYYSLDAHLLYRPLMDLFHLHLLLQAPLAKDFETAREQVFDALRNGRFYSAIHAAAPANGFKFWAEKGEKSIQMGETVSLEPPLNLRVETPADFAREIRLIHDGKMIFRTEDENLSFQAAQPGTYRVEVYLKTKTSMSKKIPWILANPIFLREDKK